MARVRFTHPQPNISREDVRSRRRRRLRLERRRCRQHLRRMLFLPCGFNRRRHSAPGDRTRHTVPARTRGAWDTPARGRASRHDMTRSKRRRRLRSSALRVERHRHSRDGGGGGRGGGGGTSSGFAAPAADDWWSHTSAHVKQLVAALGGVAVISVDEFHHVVRVAFQRASDEGMRRPSHWLSASSRATVARLASAANVSRSLPSRAFGRCIRGSCLTIID